jgi:hypothetical protein
MDDPTESNNITPGEHTEVASGRGYYTATFTLTKAEGEATAAWQIEKLVPRDESASDEAEEEEQEEEFAYVEYLDDPCTCAWSTEDGDISISIDGTFDAESMRTLGRHLLNLSSRLERPFSADAIHHWFDLSYAQYLTIPRSALQSMPDEWQSEFVALLEELDETIDWRPKEGRYWVQLKDRKGRYVADPLMDYGRGRRRLERRKG